MARALWILAVACVLVVNVGCQHSCFRRPLCRRDPAPPPFVPPGPPQPYMPPIQQSGAVVPPGATLPPGTTLLPGTTLVTPAPSISKSPADRFDPQWLPPQTPEPELRKDLPPSIKLYAPEPIDKEMPPAKDDDSARKPSPQRSFPAIAQFAEAKDKVFAGLRPSLEGLDWLQQNGIKTVVQIRLFGEDDSADRKQIEKRGMRYVAIEISPQVVTKDRADDFVQLLRESAKDGIFVYDEDSSLAGAMWYLYLRQGEILDEEPAQLRARALGLQTGREGQHRDMWLAVRKYLGENNP